MSREENSRVLFFDHVFYEIIKVISFLPFTITHEVRVWLYVLNILIGTKYEYSCADLYAL